MELTADILRTLGEASWRSLALAGVALAALESIRTRSGAVRHAVWMTAVCAMLLLPFAIATLPSIPVRVLRPEAVVIRPPAPIADGAAAMVGQPAAAAARPTELGWPEWALALYLAGAAAFLGRLLYGYTLGRRLVRGSAAIDDNRVQGAPCPVNESGLVAAPLTLGWISPTILLPPGWREWDEKKLEAALAHEGAHVRRRDWLWALAAAVNRSLFWFHPLAWWMERHAAVLAEEACDDATLAVTRDGERYAAALVDMAASVRAAQGRVFSHAIGMARVSQLRQRIEKILDGRPRLSRGMTGVRWTALALCGAPLIYAAAAVQLRPAENAVALRANPREVVTRTTDGASDFWVRASLRFEPSSLPSGAKPVAHLRAPAYPPLARQARVAGRVVVSVTAGENGSTRDVRVVSGHPLLESAATEAARDLGIEPPGARARIEYRFEIGRLEEPVAQAGRPGARAPETTPARLIRQVAPVIPPEVRDQASGVVEVEAHIGKDGKVLDARATSGPGSVRAAAAQAVRRWEFEPARLNGAPVEARYSVAVYFVSPRPARATVPAPAAGDVQGDAAAGAATKPNPIQKTAPMYPPLAQRARIQGTVRFTATIGVDGHVKDLRLENGHPLLVSAARECVQEWLFTPALQNGQAVESLTEVAVPFRLDE